jgi:predicted phosphodiesterase
LKKYTKEQILNDYINLAKKLGKLPSIRDCLKLFKYDKQTIVNYFGSHNKLKQEAIKNVPELESFIMPARLETKDIEVYRLELEKKKRVKGNKQFVQDVSSLDYLAQFAENIFKGKILPRSIKKTFKPSQRALNLTLSDLHFGSDTKEEETGFLSYGKVEESRRFAAIIQQTIEYKKQYRDITELHVNLLGDIIQHKLHDPQDAAPLAEQQCRAIHLLIQGIAQLAENFPKVVVHCASGNHGRNLSRHKERATSGKWDSIETVIYYAVKQALCNYKNLVIDIPKTPYTIYEVLGHKVFATHGDNVLDVGNPGKSLNIGKLENQINRINATMLDNEEIKIAIVGHTHQASHSSLSSGADVITNGCLPPVDQFAVSIGILENKASQTLFEMTPKHALGDIRFIKVGQEEDKDESLNELIKPWNSF